MSNRKPIAVGGVQSHSRPESRMVVHADDFGETAEITRGICEAIEGGAVTSTTIMANMEGTADALPRVAALADRASFGVHLNLCEGTPLTSGRTIVDAQGQFHRKRALFLRAVTGRLSLAEVEAEVSAQISLVHDAGVRISHVDGHKHLHQLPIVSEAVARVLPRFGIERVRLTRLGHFSQLRAPAVIVRELLSVSAGAAFRRARLRSPRRVVDLQAVMALGADAGAMLLEPKGPIEMFCHPGTASADVQKPSSCARHSELQFLLSARFRTLIAAHNLRLITYWDI
jgi:predicted glycoside hydrolase/deacetylase ChbG (UPF0249 family)